ncbi:MAG: TetR/AcrR family transcriptional regulator [Bacteroidota bacterium]|nr:TetR/AcrR family transcriptional regulator [Bacteroidota bacterium]
METSTRSKKEKIEKTATLMFRQKGYAATSMRDLAFELNIEAASLYSHISSKESILRDICLRMAMLFFKAIEKAEQQAIGDDSEELLKVAIKEHVKVITHDIAASAVFLNEWRHLSEPYLSEFIDLREQYEKRFMGIVDKGIKNNEFLIEDEKLATQFILSSLNWTHSWYKTTGKLSPEEIGNRLAKYIIHGIKK